MSKIIGPNIVPGAVLWLDAANPKSYVSGSTSWYDLSGNGNSGTLISGSGYSSANFGSITFDGVNDYVDCGTTFIDFTNQMTVNVWGKINGNPLDGILVTKGEHNGSASSNFGFQIAPSLSLRLYAKTSGSSYTTVDSSANIRDNNIANYCVSFSSGNVVFYKNGILYSSHIFGLSSLPQTPGPLYLGALKGYTGYYPGNLYTTQIYNRTLSAQEVLQNFNATRGRFGI